MVRRPASVRAALVVGLLAVTGTGCAATTYDASLETTATTAAATTTTMPVGTAEELLPVLVDEAADVSPTMVADGNARPIVERIDALWAAVRQQVARERPELLGDFDANVERMGNAVRFRRAADADKAATNLSALVTAFLA